MKVLVAYPFKTALENDEVLVYDPSLAKQDLASLASAIKEHKPDILVVGNNNVTREVLGSHPNLKHVIRRGTSLAKIDLKAAKELGIEVHNTPGVNSPFVAKYIIENLETKNIEQKIAVIGSGSIGARIARYMAENGFQVEVFSPSLANSETQEKSAKQKNLVHPNIKFVKTASEAVENSSQVIIAVDATKTVNLEDKFNEGFVNSIPKGASIITVSENKIFTAEALELLVKKANNGKFSKILIDSNPADIAKITAMGASNITLASQAMNVKGCSEAMDQVTEVVIADIVLRDLFKTTVNFASLLPENKKQESIGIIGAGILGLCHAYYLDRLGYDVQIFDAHPNPDKGFKKFLGFDTSPTNSGLDSRHLSVTETLPHATASRKDVLSKNPNEGGWQLRESLEDTERYWVQNFNHVANFPELQSIFARFVADLNIAGLSLFEEMRKNSPGLFKGVIVNERIVRIYDNEESLMQGYDLQKRMARDLDGNKVFLLDKKQVQERFPLIKHADPAGGVDVEGMVINIHKFAKNLRDYLHNRGIKISFNTKVAYVKTSDDKQKIMYRKNPKNYEQEPSAICIADKVINVSELGAREIAGLHYPFAPEQIQGVMGCWLTIPNIYRLKEGFKIHEKEPVGVINVTLSKNRENIYLSGGFGYIGFKQPSIKEPRVQELFAQVKNMAKKYFTEAFRIAENRGTLNEKFCIRPMTADGLPIIENLSQKGHYLVGGTNSGGAVETPVLALITAGIVNEIGPFKHLEKVLSGKRHSAYLDIASC